MAKIVFFLGYSISLGLVTRAAYLDGGEAAALPILALGILFASIVGAIILSGQRSE